MRYETIVSNLDLVVDSFHKKNEYFRISRKKSILDVIKRILLKAQNQEQKYKILSEIHNFFSEK